MDEVEAAYRRYLDSTADAMAIGDPSLIEGARGQALAAAEARVVALTAQGRVARGAYVADIQSKDVDGDSAALTDCYLDKLTEHDADSDEQVADHAGVRFGAAVIVERGADGWTVVEFEQEDFCVPDGLAADLESSYVGFWDAVSRAGRPPDPDHPALAAAAAGEQLDGLRDRLAEFARDGYEVRDATTSNPVASRVSDDDTVGMVRDCRELDPDGGVYDTATGELVDGGAEPGQTSLWETRLELIDGDWKVVDADLIEEVSGCVPTDF